jgi:hypothetical protein
MQTERHVKRRNCCVLYYLFRSGILLYIFSLLVFCCCCLLSNNRVLLPARQFLHFLCITSTISAPKKNVLVFPFCTHYKRKTLFCLYQMHSRKVNIYIHSTMRRDNAKTREKEQKKKIIIWPTKYRCSDRTEHRRAFDIVK